MALSLHPENISDVFRRYRKGALGTNGLKKSQNKSERSFSEYSKHYKNKRCLNFCFNEFQIKYCKIVIDNKACSKNIQHLHFNESYV